MREVSSSGGTAEPASPGRQCRPLEGVARSAAGVLPHVQHGGQHLILRLDGLCVGLPVGLHVVGPMHGEAVVLRVARAYERAAPPVFPRMD